MINHKILLIIQHNIFFHLFFCDKFIQLLKKEFFLLNKILYYIWLQNSIDKL